MTEQILAQQQGIVYWKAVTFPFRQRVKILTRMWWVLLINWVPIVNMMLIRGWRLDIVRRMVNDEENLLPEIKDVGRFIKDGFLLWCMTLIYSSPLLLLNFFDIGIFKVLWGIIKSLYTGGEMISFGEAMQKIFVQLAIMAAYFTVTWPIYRIGMIRYAQTGKIRSFFYIPQNIQIVFKHFRYILKVLFLYIFTSAIVIPISGLLVSSLIGSALVPLVTLPFFYWTIGYLYGSLARIVRVDL